MKKKLIALAVGCLIFSCAKDFNNPIDPDNKNALPPTPQNLKVFPVENTSKVQGSFEYKYANAFGVIIERRPASSGQPCGFNDSILLGRRVSAKNRRRHCEFER